MTSLHTPSWEMERGMLVGEEEEEEEEEGVTEDGGEASVTDDSEPEWDTESPPVVPRKVSFADAFGLDLVSVKEFDEVADLAGSGVNKDEPLSEKVISPYPQAQAENHLSCLFSVPSSPEELRQRLREQKVELESIELLPGTATLRGVVRVVNLCYSKSVYVRVSPDAWRSHFELPAMYVPGSSDRETDRFAFLYALVPPIYGKAGSRVEFCLRYETEVGTFWANNGGLNFVLFCHLKAHKDMYQNLRELEEGHYLHHHYYNLQKGSKRSCLKANRRDDAEDEEATTTEVVVPQKAEMDGIKKADSTEIQLQDGDLLVDRVRSRPSGVKDPLCELDHPGPPQPQAPPDHHQHHRLHQHHHHSTAVPGGTSDCSSTAIVGAPRQKQPAEGPQTLPTYHQIPVGPRQKQPAEGPQTLPTYHQIPLLTLDWRSDDPQWWDNTEVEELWTHNLLAKPPTEGDPPSAGDPKQASVDGKDECRADDGSLSVCDIWQRFINGGDRNDDHSGVPESIWLQSATSLSPTEQRAAEDPDTTTASPEPRPQIVQTHPDTHTAHSRAQKHPAVSEGQPVSVSHGGGLVAALANSQERQPAGGCAGSRDTTLEPDGSSVTDSLQEGATTATAATTTTTPAGNKDSSNDGSGTQWPECVASETRDTESLRAQKGGGGGEDGGERETLRAPTGDCITSSGERGTTEMTAAAESQNASDVDRISRGAGSDEGLSESRGEEAEKEEEEVTGTVCDAEYDTLAFGEAFKGQGTKDGTGLVLFPFRRGGSGGGGGGVEEGRLTMHDTEGEGYTGEEIFRPQDAVNSECSQREAGDKDCEGFRPNKESGTALKHDKTHHGEAGPHTDAFNMDELSVYDTESTQINVSHFEHDMSALSDTMQRKGEGKVDSLQHGTSSNGGLRQKGVEVELNQEIKEEEEEEGESMPNNENSFETDLGKEAKDLTLMYSEAHEHRLDPTARDKEPHIQSETGDPGLEVLTTDQTSTAPGSSKSSQTEERASENNTDNIQIKYTSVQTQGEVLCDNPSLKSLEDETGMKRDEGKVEEIKPFQTDDHQSGPSDTMGPKFKKEAQKCLNSKKDDVCTGGGFTPANDIFRNTLPVMSGVSRDLQHPPEISEVKKGDGDEKQGIEKGQMEASMEEWQTEEEEETPGECKGREMSLEVSLDKFQRKDERKVDGLQHGTSSDVGLRQKGVEVELNQEIKVKEEEEGESMPNNENSFETDLGKEAKDLTLMYSEAHEHRLDPTVRDKEPHIHSETGDPGLEVLTTDQTSTAPGSSKSSQKEEGSSENNDMKLSTLKQELWGEMNTDNIQIKYTSVQTQGEVLSDNPSLKSLEDEMGMKRDEGKGEEIKPFQTDDSQSGPSDAMGLKSKKEAQKCLNSEKDDVCPGGGITPADDILRNALPVTSGVSRDLQHPPEISEVEEADGDEKRGIEKGQMGASMEEWRTEEEEETPGECKGREVSLEVSLDTFQTKGERKVDGLQHGTSSNGGLRQKDVEVELNQEIKQEEEEEGESMPNNENSFETDLGKEVKNLTLIYSEAHEHRLDPTARDKEPHIHSEAGDPGIEVLTTDQTSTAAGSSKSSRTEEGASENNTDNIQIKYTSVQTQGEVLSNNHSLKGLEDETSMKRDEGKGEEIKPFQTDEKRGIEKGQMGASMEEWRMKEEEETPGECKGQEMLLEVSLDTFQRKDERKVDGLQHGTSSNGGLRQKGVKVELNQEIKEEEEEEEEGESMPNNENSFETDLGKEAKDLTLMYSAAHEHCLDLTVRDKEPHIHSETGDPGLEVLTTDQTSTAPGSSKSSRKEEGASENTDMKLSTLKQELGEMNTDNIQIKYTSVQTQGEVLSDNPSLKSLEDETGMKRDEGKGEEMKPFQTDDCQSGPSDTMGLKCEKEAQKCLNSEKDDVCPDGGITPADDIFRNTLPVTSGVSRDLQHPPEISEVEEGDGDEKRGIEKGQMGASMEEWRTEEEEETPGECKGREVSLEVSLDKFQRKDDRKVDGLQHGTSSDVGLRQKGVEVELNQEIKEEEEEEGESMPNNEKSFETDLGKEAKDLTLMYSEAHEHWLDPTVQDKEPHIHSETGDPGLEVLTTDQTSTAPGSSKSSRTKEGASENNDMKLSTLKQELWGEMNTDNIQIKYTSVQTQGEVLSDNPSLKSLEDETGMKRDEGKGEEIKPFQTDDRQSGPSDAMGPKCEKEAQKCLNSEKDDVRAGGGIAPADDIFRNTLPVTSGVSRDLQHPPEISEVEEGDGDEKRGIEKGQMEASMEEWRTEEEEETPGECKGREVSLEVSLDTFQTKGERKVDGLQHGTSSNGGLRQKGVEVELNQEIKQEEEEEEGESMPNNENSFETNLGKEVKDLTLMYSEAHEHRLDPTARDKEPHIQSETGDPGIEVLTTDQTSTAPGSSKSSQTEEGASDNNTDNIQIKYTLVQTQGEVLSDNPSLKSLEDDTVMKRDEGKGEEMKPFQTDNHQSGPSDAMGPKCEKEAQKCLNSEKDDVCPGGGITPADDILRNTLPVTSGVSRDLQHPPEISEVEEGDGDEKRGIEKGQMGASMEEWRTEEEEETPGECKGREVSLEVSLDTFQTKGERKVDGLQHGTSSNGGLRQKGVEVELNQEIKEEEEEEGESMPNNENSFETDLGKEVKDLTLIYSEAHEHRLDPTARDKEPHIHSETGDPGLEVLTTDQTSTAPGSSKSSRTEEGASENNTDNIQIKYTLVQTQGEVLSDNPSLKGLEDETSMKRDEGKGEEIKPFQTDEKRGIEKGQMEASMEEWRTKEEEETFGECKGQEMSLEVSLDTFQRKDERKVDGLQHGTSSNGGLRQKGVEVELNQKIKEEEEEEEEEGESMPNNENSFETDLGEEVKDLTLIYSEAHEHRLDPTVRDKEPHIHSETGDPGLEVLTTDQTSTAPGSSKSSRTEEGASENNDVKLSTLKQELGEMNTDNIQIKYTSVQTQGEVFSDNPSLKSLEDETGMKRDEGKGEEIKPFQTDDHQSGPSDAMGPKCEKEAQKCLNSEKDDLRAGVGITPADDIFRNTLAATSGVSRDLQHPPEISEVEEGDGDEKRGIEKGQIEASMEEWRTEEEVETPGECKGREVSLRVDGAPQEEVQGGIEDDIISATNSPEDLKFLTTVNQGIGHNSATNEDCTIESHDPTNIVETVGINELQQHLQQISIKENNEPESRQSPDLTSNFIPEENRLITEPCVFPRLRQTHAGSMEKNLETFNKPKDRSDSYQDPCSQLEDLTVEHPGKFNQATAQDQDKPNASPQNSAPSSSRNVAKTVVCAVVACVFIAILSQNALLCTYFATFI